MGLTYQSGPGARRVKPSDLMSRGSVQVRGQSLFYEAAGAAEDGPTILFIHESGGSSATWNGQLTGLAQRARCLALDLPGHGRSEGLGYSSVSEYCQVVLDFLDALAIRWPVVVAGVCLGAAVAADLAIHAPNRAAGLILCGVSPEGRACPLVREAAARGEVPEEFVEGLFGPGVSQRLYSDRIKRWRLTSPLARHGDLTAVCSYPMMEAVTAVIHPALIVAGEHDPIATPEIAHTVGLEMQDARVAVVERAGCLCMAEQPAAFNRTITHFLTVLEPPLPAGFEVRRIGGYRRF